MADGELINYHRRMLARLIPLAALMLTGCLTGENVGRGSDLRAPDDAKRTFASCPGADALATATDVSWAPQASRLAEHRNRALACHTAAIGEHLRARVEPVLAVRGRGEGHRHVRNDAEAPLRFRSRQPRANIFLARDP
jgi:hypothetical protein